LVDHVAGRGAPIILVHGGSGSHRHWERVITPLAEHFEVHAPDLPGFGLSPDVPNALDGDAYVALVASSLARLVPTESVDLVGFSFGGAVAAGVARVWGRRTARLSLIGSAGFGNVDPRRAGRRSSKDTDGSKASLRDVVRHNLQAMMFADPATADDRAVDQQIWNRAHARYDSLKVSLQKRLVHDLTHLTCPVELIWGARDALAYPSPWDCAECVRAVRPDAGVEFVAGAGHWTQYERPDVIVQLLLAFHGPR